MSDYTVSKPVEMFGRERAFRALSGVVLGAAQRSDTYVSGGGSVDVYGGYGGGRVSVDSTVVVTSNLWIRGISGREYRLEFYRDIPVREGNVVHAIDIVDATERDVRISNGYVYLYNSATKEWFYTAGLNDKVRNLHFWPVFFRTFTISLLVIFLALLVYTQKFGLAVAATILFGTVVAGIIAIFTAIFRYRHLFSPSKQLEAYKILDRIFESTFMSELDEIAKQFTAPASVVPTIEKSNHASTVLTCTQCGKPVEEGNRFCGSCGTQIAANPA